MSTFLERPQVPDRAPTFPKEIFWGGSRDPAVEAGAGAAAAASEADPPWPPEILSREVWIKLLDKSLAILWRSINDHTQNMCIKVKL